MTYVRRHPLGLADTVTDTFAGGETRALLAELTLEEKAELLGGSGSWTTSPVERLGVPAVTVADGPHGLRMQTDAMDHNDLHQSVPATCFPPAVSLACAWDPPLARRVGAALGDECRAAGVSVLLGPGINMKRSPLCGRNFEYFSEDPALAGAVGVAWVDGVQSRTVGTSLKHFAANNQETDRLRVSAEVDERTLREIYFAAFERVVKEAQPWTVMCSYNRINGVYSSENHWLLTEVLRDEWGFDGLVVSDWGAVNRRDVGVAAGLDLEMPSSAGFGTQTILDAVAAGELSEEQIDRCAVRVLELVDRAGAREPLEIFDADAHHALAREAAAAGIVLLKNEHSVLPIDPEGARRIAVIGEFARTPRYQGAGSSRVNPTRLDNALDSLNAAIAGRRELVFASGFAIDSEEGDPELIADAVRIAADAEVVILFLGLPPSYESEGYDRTHMDLPAPQLQLLAEIAAVNSNVVVVLSNGSAVLVSDWEHQARAVVEGWLLGQAGGSALADILLGRVSPSGKLAETIPRRLEDNPALGNFPGDNQVVRYGEGLLIGYRWYDARKLPVSYPFGHGLSYTDFDYADLRLTGMEAGCVEVSLTLTNTGTRAAADVVQVYVSDPVSSVFRPTQELRGFAKVSLEPGESRRVTVELDDRAFAFWHSARGGWVVEGGDFEVRVGSSSRDIRLTGAITLAGTEAASPLSMDSTLAEFCSQPDAKRWLREQLEKGTYGERLLESELGRMLETVPLRRFARLPGSGFSEADMERFLTDG
jgi:beta-glucosidase